MENASSKPLRVVLSAQNALHAQFLRNEASQINQAWAEPGSR